MSEALPNYRPLGSYWHTAVFSTTTSTEGAEQRSIYSLFHLDPENQITLKQRGDPPNDLVSGKVLIIPSTKS